MARAAVANHAGTYSHYFGATPSWTGLYMAFDSVCGTPSAMVKSRLLSGFAGG